MRILIVAGFPTGLLIAGIGGRLSMLLLRVTSPDEVMGLTSDDGFTIGELTLAGTYNLLALGAVVGFIGAAAYRAVAPWLIGPIWLRRLTTGTGAGPVVGSIIVHTDGVDFNLLKPTWLPIVLFVGLPAVLGVVIGAVVDRVATPGSWPTCGRRWWAIPICLLVLFPQAAIVVVLATPLMLLSVLAGRGIATRQVPTFVAASIRVAWSALATSCLVFLMQDIQSLV